MGTQSRDEEVIPADLTREHILQAMDDFDKNGVPRGFGQSVRYDVVYEDRHYPPPALVAIAIKHLTGMLPPAVIQGGKKSRCFQVLEKCGFEVVEKRRNLERK